MGSEVVSSDPSTRGATERSEGAKRFVISPHKDAPQLSDPEKGALYLEQVIAELEGNLQVGEEIRELIRQVSLVNLWFFLKFVAGFAGPFDKLNLDLHREMCNFAQLEMKPGRKAAAFIPRFHYKDLDKNTKVLTQNRGWVTHGEIRVGDTVFAHSGKAVRVLGLSERFFDQKGVRITFTDGSVVDSGNGHLWRVIRHKRKRPYLGKRPGKYKYRVENISYREYEIIEASELRIGDDVGELEAPLEYLEAALPLHPYYLGAWLGDGCSDSGDVCAGLKDKEILERISRFVVDSRIVMCPSKPGLFVLRVRGVRKLFRELGLRGNKHIPEVYKRAGVKQRFELLRGLMDTDGSAGGGRSRSTATFTNVNERLVNDVYELAASLALRPRRRHYGGVCGGKLYGFWQVSFQHFSDRNPFWLGRKAAFALQPSRRRGSRKIKSIEPIVIPESSCLVVDGGMYLVGEQFVPTHNSTIFTIGAPVWLAVRDPNVRLRVNASKVERASSFLETGQHIIDSNEFFAWLFEEWVPEKNSKGWNALEMVLPNRTKYFKEPTIRAGSVGEASEGDHFDGIIHDDIIGKHVVNVMGQSRTEMAKITKDWKTDNSTLIIDATSSFIFTVGTRYGLDDTYEEIMRNLKRMYGYRKVLFLGGYKEEPANEWTVYYRCVREDDEEGVPRIIFPEAVTEDYLERMLRDDPWTYWTQMVNLPQQAGLVEFGDMVIRDCEVVDRDGEWMVFVCGTEEWVSFKKLEVTGGFDPAFTEKGITAKTSRSAVVLWGQDALRRKFLLDYRVGYVSPLTAIDWIFELVGKYRGHVRVFYFEKAAGQKFLRSLAEEEKLKRGVFVTFDDVSAISDKDARIRSVLGPELESGRVYVPKSGALEFREEVKSFPQAHLKDLLDASVTALVRNLSPMSDEDEAELDEQDERFATRTVNAFGWTIFGGWV